MKRFWFKLFAGLLMGSFLGEIIFLLPNQAEAYQDASTPTGIYITVIYSEDINVRSGPSTVLYPVRIGQLKPGDTAPALGVSTGHEWVQISFPSGPNGVGWVYAEYVSISGGELRVVEAPPTPTPLATNTFDPTLAAAFIFQPTLTRVPTFTPPPPLDIPKFDDASASHPSGIASGVLVISLALIGGLGLIVSFVLSKR